MRRGIKKLYAGEQDWVRDNRGYLIERFKDSAHKFKEFKEWNKEYGVDQHHFGKAVFINKEGQEEAFEIIQIRASLRNGDLAPHDRKLFQEAHDHIDSPATVSQPRAEGKAEDKPAVLYAVETPQQAEPQPLSA